MRKIGWKLNSKALRAQKLWFMVVEKIDDDDIIINKKKWLGCIWKYEVCDYENESYESFLDGNVEEMRKMRVMRVS